LCDCLMLTNLANYCNLNPHAAMLDPETCRSIVELHVCER
jgi:hypothetical protein